MDISVPLCRFVQLSARIPLVILGIYICGTFLSLELFDDLDRIPVIHDIRGLGFVLQVTAEVFVLTMTSCLFISFAYDNLHITTALFVAAPVMLTSFHLVASATFWRLIVIGIYSIVLLTLLPFAVIRRLEPLFKTLRPQPRTKEVAALLTLYAVVIFAVITKIIFPELARNPTVLHGVHDAGPYLLGIPLVFILDLAALQSANSPPGFSRGVATTALVIVAIPIWYPLISLLKKMQGS